MSRHAPCYKMVDFMFVIAFALTLFRSSLLEGALCDPPPGRFEVRKETAITAVFT